MIARFNNVTWRDQPDRLEQADWIMGIALSYLTTKAKWSGVSPDREDTLSIRTKCSYFQWPHLVSALVSMVPSHFRAKNARWNLFAMHAVLQYYALRTTLAMSAEALAGPAASHRTKVIRTYCFLQRLHYTHTNMSLNTPRRNAKKLIPILRINVRMIVVE